MSSTVLIDTFTGVNTEIAKNLALTAINIILHDPRKITLDALRTNFLFSQSSEYHPEARFDQEGAAILKDMNPFIKIEVLETLHQAERTSVGQPKDWCLHVSPLDLSRLLTPNTMSSAIVDEEPQQQAHWTPKISSISFCYRFVAYLQTSSDTPTVETAVQMVLNGVWDAPDLRDLFLSLKDPSLAGLISSNSNELCPVYSVGGSILSQEVVSFIKDPTKATQGWIYYDALGGSAKIYPYKPQKAAGTTSD